jgi:hypothetical protein
LGNGNVTTYVLPSQGSTYVCVIICDLDLKLNIVSNSIIKGIIFFHIR